MKKILTFILLLSALSAGCLFPTLGAFAMSSMDSGMHQNMNHDMGGDMMMPCDSGDDSPSMHECCESPFNDSVSDNRSSTLSDSDESDNGDTTDLKVLCALHENLTSNSLHRLNSPPRYGGLSDNPPSNTYIDLTGIVKNNS